MLFALAVEAALGQRVSLGDGLFAVEGLHHEIVALGLDAQDAFDSLGLEGFAVGLALARHAHDIDVFADDAVLLDQLIEAVSIAGLEEDEDLALLAGFLDEIFGKVVAAEIGVDELLVHLLGGGEYRRGDVIDEFAGLPAENTLDGAALQKFLGLGQHHFLHLRSSNLLFSPSSVTVLTNSFMVAANFAPSAADTHSTRVRSFSMPR